MAGDRDRGRRTARDEVQAWLAEHWDPDLTVDEWWQIVADAGWTAPHFRPSRAAVGCTAARRTPCAPRSRSSARCARPAASAC